MKKILSAIIFTICTVCIYAQNNVGVGTSAPNASAKVDISSTDKGILIPRMTTAQRIAISAPANGLLVYDNDTAAFFYYNGSMWKKLLNGNFITETDPQVSSSTNNYVPRWNGTTLEDGVILDNDTNVAIGSSPSSAAKLLVNGFTKLGTAAPSVKMLKLTVTSPATAGGVVTVAHGLTMSKILSVNVLLDPDGASLLPPRYDNPGLDYSYRVTTSDIEIYAGASAAAAILSKPITILITYEM